VAGIPVKMNDALVGFFSYSLPFYLDNLQFWCQNRIRKYDKNEDGEESKHNWFMYTGFFIFQRA
jgi:hypothetical protein